MATLVHLRVDMGSEDLLNEHRLLRISIWRYIMSTRLLVLLSVPLIYACVFPFMLLDAFVWLFQSVCFPIYRIPKARRRNYVVFDRGRLAYLNAMITGMLNRQASALFTFLLTMAAVACAANLAYLDLGTRGTACCMVPDGLGNVYVVGSAAGESGTAISVTRLDAANHVVGSFRFGGSADEPRAAVLDPMGNLLVAGQTRSSDFPLIHPLITQTEPGAPAGFIAKVNLSNGQILFSTLIGGVAAEQFIRLGTTVNAVATDLAGNIYAGGVTNASDFPVSANAFQKTGAGGDTFGPRPFGFVLKLSPDGDRLLYSTLLGGLTANCFGGSHCVGINASTTVNAVAVDRNGVATVAGATNAPDFPATAGVVQNVCRCLESANNGFVTQLNAAGSGLVWSTFLGGTWYGFSQVPFGVNSISAVALDSAGNVTVAGKTDADDFLITAGVLQPKLAGPPTSGRRPIDGFVSRLNATGTALLFSTYLGGSAADQINGLQLDTAGNVWLTGPTNSSDFPGTPAPFTGSFFAEISSDGTRLLASQRTPTGATGQSILAGADIRVLGATGSVIHGSWRPGIRCRRPGHRQLGRRFGERLHRARGVCQFVWQLAGSGPRRGSHTRQSGPDFQPARRYACAVRWHPRALALCQFGPDQRLGSLRDHRP
jgi:hypothetical protein